MSFFGRDRWTGRLPGARAVPLALLVVALATPAAAQEPWPTVCLCQSGVNARHFFGEIEITDANRAAIARRIESGELDLRKTATLGGSGCEPKEWRRERLCGFTSTLTQRPDGTRETRNVNNAPVPGPRTIAINNTGGIPYKVRPSQGDFSLDPERWARVRVITVGGTQP